MNNVYNEIENNIVRIMIFTWSITLVYKIKKKFFLWYPWFLNFGSTETKNPKRFLKSTYLGIAWTSIIEKY